MFGPNNAAMPNMPYYRLHEWSDSPCDTIGSVATQAPIKLENWAVFPNPAGNEIHVQFPQKLAAFATVQLSNINGKMVKSQELVPGSAELTISLLDLSSGTYFLKAISAEKLFEPQKIIVIH